jgi:hypothetical protein
MTMYSLIERVDQQQPRPLYMQVARAGAWEDAVLIEDTLDKDTWLTDPLETIDETVAAEIFYELDGGGIAFSGFRFSPNLSQVNSPESFIHEITQSWLTGQIKHLQLAGALFSLGRRLNGSGNTYMTTAPEHCELGVIDNWQSLGSAWLPIDGQTPPDDDLSELLQTNQNLIRNRKNHIALEFAWLDPHHWLGIQVSDKVGDEFVLNIERLQQLMKAAETA